MMPKSLDSWRDGLDRTVCHAYGWPHDILADEDAMLARLLALNLDRAGTDSPPVAPEDSDET